MRPPQGIFQNNKPCLSHENVLLDTSVLSYPVWSSVPHLRFTFTFNLLAHVLWVSTRTYLSPQAINSRRNHVLPAEGLYFLILAMLRRGPRSCLAAMRGVRCSWWGNAFSRETHVTSQVYFPLVRRRGLFVLVRRVYENLGVYGSQVSPSQVSGPTHSLSGLWL